MLPDVYLAEKRLKMCAHFYGKSVPLKQILEVCGYSITIIWHKYNKLLAALSVDGGHQYIRPPSVGNSLPHEWSIPFHLDLLGPDIQNSPLL